MKPLPPAQKLAALVSNGRADSAHRQQHAIQECADYDPGNRLSTGDAVPSANAVAKRLGIYAGVVNAEENDALVMVGRSLLGIDDEALTRLSSDLKEKSRDPA